ncbi:3-deoxy-D-manno-octulosonate 8-phosphate phosphatase [human gut metagenome]|uniref:3-deoxy-D-manno-octulosonate 8-phosphate phosphatase n=1 Tax=human gut metagenome TaxID=408170 RepID=K1TDP5_9ZZZZ
MDESTYFEIDEPSDWVIIEKQLEHRLKKNTEKVDLNEIKLFLTDCDGCLTDGGMYYSNAGDEMKRFNTLDGMGIQLLRQQGVLTGIITGENTMLNQRRGDKLHLDILKQGIKDKTSDCQVQI